MPYGGINQTVLVLLEIVAISFIGYLIYDWYQQKAKRHHEFATKMLDKMSSKEFVDLLKTNEGRKSVERILGSHKTPQEWITEAIRRALFLGFTGLGLLAAAFILDYFSGIEIFVIVGFVLVGIAIGYLIAAAATRRRAGNDDADTTA